MVVTMVGPRIVSLLPAATEMVAALGLGDLLVGRSHGCDFPKAVRRLPAVTRPRVEGTRGTETSAQGLVSEALSDHLVDAELLRRLAPTHVLTRVNDDVSVGLEDLELALDAWLRGAPRLVVLNPGSLDDVFADLERLAGVLGAADSGESLAAWIQVRMLGITRAAEPLMNRPRVALLTGMEPLKGAGRWMPELVAMAGGEALFGARARHSPLLPGAALAAADPDVILVAPASLDLDQAQGEAPMLLARVPGFAELRATRLGRVILADGNAYFNRPGPRLVESVEIVAEVIHPQRFSFGHEGTGWMRLG